MNVFNGLLTSTFDLVLAPFASSPAWTLIAVSVVSGVVMTLVFRYTSNQAELRAVVRRTRSTLLCMRLFRDDFGLAVRCQGDLLRSVGRRLWLSLAPVAVLCVPFLLVLSQLALRFEHRPLAPGEAAVVAVSVRESDWPAWREASFIPPPGVRVETPALRDDGERTLYWRVRLERAVEAPGQCRVTGGGDLGVVEKQITGRSDPTPLRVVSVRRPGSSVWQRVLHPGEPALTGAGPIDAITVGYPRRSTPVLGVDVPWWLTFLIVSMATALAAKPFLRVQF